MESEIIIGDYKCVNTEDHHEVTKNGQFKQSGQGPLTREEVIAVMNEQEFQQMYYAELGMCGCGSPADVREFLKTFVENFGGDNGLKKNRELIKTAHPDLFFEIIGHLLEHAGLLEHGTSVYSSWPTDKGKEFIRLVKEYKEDD